MPAVVIVIIVLVAAALVAGVVIWFLNKRVERSRLEQEDMIRQTAQIATVLIIDKRKLRLPKAGLPDVAMNEVKWYQKLMKVPVVKVKVGPRIMNMLADPRVYDALPVKSEAKVVVSGLYITEIRSVRGGGVPAAAKKPTITQRIRSFFTGGDKADQKNSKSKK